MNLNSIQKNFKRYILNFTQTQLIVTLASIPILIGWGLQISLMSFVGNLIFTPILTIFLILSSLIFFTELFGIPNLFFIKMLEIITIFWKRALEFGSKKWLLGFCHPTTLILFLFPVSFFLILLIIKHKKANYKIVLIFICLFCSFLLLAFLPKLFIKNQNINDFYNKKLTIKFDADNKITLIDNGFFNTKASPEKTIDYELKQYLIKKTGATEIKNITLLKPGYRTFKATQTLCKKLDVKNVTLPFFNKNLTKSAWREFFKLKELLQEKKINFIRTKINQIHHSKVVEPSYPTNS